MANKIFYGKQFIDQKDKNNVLKALSSDLITRGKFVKTFENNLKKYFVCKNAITCSSGTAALHLAFLSIS